VRVIGSQVSMDIWDRLDAHMATFGRKLKKLLAPRGMLRRVRRFKPRPD
jgi:hypothetical protein